MFFLLSKNLTNWGIWGFTKFRDTCISSMDTEVIRSLPLQLVPLTRQQIRSAAMTWYSMKQLQHDQNVPTTVRFLAEPPQFKKKMRFNWHGYLTTKNAWKIPRFQWLLPMEELRIHTTSRVTKRPAQQGKRLKALRDRNSIFDRHHLPFQLGEIASGNTYPTKDGKPEHHPFLRSWNSGDVKN